MYEVYFYHLIKKILIIYFYYVKIRTLVPIYKRKLVLPILRDRGIKKWVSLMLPEYVQALRELEVDDYKINKPILDQQQYEELNRLIFEALANDKPVPFSYYSNGTVEVVTGKIQSIDEIKKEIRIMDTESYSKVLKIENIVRIGE